MVIIKIIPYFNQILIAWVWKCIFNFSSFSKIFRFRSEISLVIYISISIHHCDIWIQSSVGKCWLISFLADWRVFVVIYEIFHWIYWIFCNVTANPLSQKYLSPATFICDLIFLFYTKLMWAIIIWSYARNNILLNYFIKCRIWWPQ